jgi:DNA-binding IclR family transcriptional regulator
LHCTSDGKVLLAYHPDRWQRCIATRPLERFTAHTIVDPARLHEQLQTIRVDDYGYTVEELEVGLNAVAAPIYAADGTVVATIGVSGPTFRLPATSIPEVGALARSAAAEISRRLGFTAPGSRVPRDQEPAAIPS